MSRRYLPWWRTGAATLITTPDGPGIAWRAAVDVTATVNASSSAAVTARLYGPGDAQLIDPRQVIRSEPEPGTRNFEPNYFPSVEFDAPELPWMLTPAKANAAQQLRPWLVLVVVTRAACSLDSGADPLPVLAVEDAAADLPDLDQSWAWAHVQVTGRGAPADILGSGAAERTLSRLVCPRRLKARTAYVAAVVPAFAQGVQAGLGETVDPGPLGPAWNATTTFVELPVHHSWEFTTGDLGDFEELVSRLRFAPLDSQVLGGMRVRADDLQARLPDAGTIRVPGALGTGDDVPPPVGATFAGALRALLDVVSATPAHPDLPVPAPAYGRWHAGRRAAPAVGAAGWLADLNLHPAARSVAALGTRVVQERQEQLMAAAWAQVGPIVRANRLLRQGQLAREAGAALHRRQVAPLRDADLLAVAGPALGRILHGRRTTAAVAADHRVPPALFAVAARRALRRRGPIGRRAGVDLAALIERANDRGRAPVGRPLEQPAGMVTADEVGRRFDLPRLCTTRPEWWREQPGPTQQPHRTLAESMRRVLSRHSEGLGPCTPPPVPGPLPVGDLADTVRAVLDPETAVTKRIRTRLTLPPGWAPEDPLEPLLVAPEFPTPMYRAVADISPSLLLPGVDRLEQDSVCLVGTNPWFVQAFMAGLNHEMGRELLWRGFPTDQRGTGFRRFWDRAGGVPPLVGEELDDILPVTDWTLGEGLGLAGRRRTTAGTPVPAAQTVLVARGEVLRRYPRTVIHAARATWGINAEGERVRRLPDDAEETYPQFGGTLPPDTTFVGFGLTPAQAWGTDADDPGYYFVFQQQPTEPRFGLNESPPAPLTDTWADLSWNTVAMSASGHLQLTASDPITVSTTADPRGLHFTTGATSAEIAAVAEQRPYRVAIHARNLMDEP